MKKGISLVALVITIIILIILTGTIILTAFNNGILDKSNQVVKDNNEVTLKQRVGRVLLEAQIANYSDLDYSIEDNLKLVFEEIYGQNNVVVLKIGQNYEIKIANSKTIFKINKDGRVEEYEYMDPTSVYARLDDEGTLYLRATEKEGYRLYKSYQSIKEDWNTKGDASRTSVLKVIIEEKIAPTTTYGMFSFSNLEEIQNIKNLHTENSTDMSYMFYGCNKLKDIDLSYFNTQKVKNMNQMFHTCRLLDEIDVSNFDTRLVTNMNGLFYGCSNLTKLDISNFDTNKVTKMGYMFINCTNLAIIKLGRDFVINDGTDLTKILISVPSNIKITATEATRDTLISVSDLISENFEIIK